MARWQPGSRTRLAEAAMRLYATRGFDDTTVAEIAAEAGLTERTFFRYYADKREVLFAGQEDFEAAFLDPLPASADGPRALVEAALAGVAGFFPDERRDWARGRTDVLAAHPSLLEREQHKMSSLAGALTAAYAERGLEPLTAALAGDLTVSVFRTAFGLWLAPGETRSFVEVQAEVWARLGSLLVA